MKKKSKNKKRIGGGRSASPSKPGSGTGQSQTWEELKARILEAMGEDEQPQVFEALLADTSNYMTALMQTG